MCSWTRIRKSLDVLAKRTCGVDHPPKNRPMLGWFPQGKQFPLRIESLRQLTNGIVNGVLLEVLNWTEVKPQQVDCAVVPEILLDFAIGRE
jgi:hypothetical protein